MGLGPGQADGAADVAQEPQADGPRPGQVDGPRHVRSHQLDVQVDRVVPVDESAEPAVLDEERNPRVPQPEPDRAGEVDRIHMDRGQAADRGRFEGNPGRARQPQVPEGGVDGPVPVVERNRPPDSAQPDPGVHGDPVPTLPAGDRQPAQFYPPLGHQGQGVLPVPEVEPGPVRQDHVGGRVEGERVGPAPEDGPEGPGPPGQGHRFARLGGVDRGGRVRGQGDGPVREPDGDDVGGVIPREGQDARGQGGPDDAGRGAAILQGLEPKARGTGRCHGCVEQCLERDRTS